MFGMRRALIAVTVLLAGCAPAPVAVQTQAPVLATAGVQAEPTAEPTADPVAEPTSAPRAEATVAPVVVPTSVPTAVPAVPAQVAQAADPDPCERGTPGGPLPAPGSAGAQDFFRSF